MLSVEDWAAVLSDSHNLGRVKETDFPSGNAETYIYGVIGNLTSKTDGNGNVITRVLRHAEPAEHAGKFRYGTVWVWV